MGQVFVTGQVIPYVTEYSYRSSLCYRLYRHVRSYVCCLRVTCAELHVHQPHLAQLHAKEYPGAVCNAPRSWLLGSLLFRIKLEVREGSHRLFLHIVPPEWLRGWVAAVKNLRFGFGFGSGFNKGPKGLGQASA